MKTYDPQAIIFRKTKEYPIEYVIVDKFGDKNEVTHEELVLFAYENNILITFK